MVKLQYWGDVWVLNGLKIDMCKTIISFLAGFTSQKRYIFTVALFYVCWRLNILWPRKYLKWKGDCENGLCRRLKNYGSSTNDPRWSPYTKAPPCHFYNVRVQQANCYFMDSMTSKLHLSWYPAKKKAKIALRKSLIRSLFQSLGWKFFLFQLGSFCILWRQRLEDFVNRCENNELFQEIIACTVIC